MQKRKFLQYAAASGLGMAGSGYLYQYATSTRRDSTPGSAAAARNAARHTPLFNPDNSGPLCKLDMSDAPFTLNARSSTLPSIPGKPSPFLIYAAQYGNKACQNPIIRVKRASQFSAALQNVWM